MKQAAFSAATAMIILILIATSHGAAAALTVTAELSSDEWQLTITGLVENPLILSLNEMAAMPQTSVNAALICVDFPGNVVAEGNWTGVNLWFLLETAGVVNGTVKVAFFASDGFSTDLPLETAKRKDVIIAYEKDGAPLGETLRLVVPGKWGYKWISQVARIELVDYDFKGFWESRGYSDSASVVEGSPGNQGFPYPSMPDAVPEFPSVLALFAPLVLVVLFAFMVKMRLKRQKQRSSGFLQSSSHKA